MYATRRIPDELRNNDELWGECISGGALYWNDFTRLAKECGFADPRLLKSRELTINNPRLQEKLGGMCEFYSATYRLFKLSDLEPDCEDYGQAVIYRGTIDSCPTAFELDSHHLIEAGKVFPYVVLGECFMTHASKNTLSSLGTSLDITESLMAAESQCHL